MWAESWANVAQLSAHVGQTTAERQSFVAPDGVRKLISTVQYIEYMYECYTTFIVYIMILWLNFNSWIPV